MNYDYNFTIQILYKYYPNAFQNIQLWFKEGIDSINLKKKTGRYSVVLDVANSELS